MTKAKTAKTKTKTPANPKQQSYRFLINQRHKELHGEFCQFVEGLYKILDKPQYHVLYSHLPFYEGHERKQLREAPHDPGYSKLIAVLGDIFPVSQYKLAKFQETLASLTESLPPVSDSDHISIIHLADTMNALHKRVYEFIQLFVEVVRFPDLDKELAGANDSDKTIWDRTLGIFEMSLCIAKHSAEFATRNFE